MRQNSRCGTGRNGGEGSALLWLETQFPQPAQKAAIDLIGLRLQETRQALKMKAELIAQYVSGVGELGRNLCSLHKVSSAA